VFPVGRWQAQGRLQQLRGPDLAFDLDETRQLLDLSDVRLRERPHVEPIVDAEPSAACCPPRSVLMSAPLMMQASWA
jgi:hypothetical protein